MKRLFIQCFLIIIAGQCTGIFCQQIPVLDLSSAIEHPDNITLSDFVESITYIPIATTYDCLVDKNPKVYVSKEYIVTINNRGKHSPPFESKWWSYGQQLQANFISQPLYFENKGFISFNFYLSKNKYFVLYDKSFKLIKVVDNNSGIKNDIDGFINITFDSMNSEGELIGLLQANELVNWINKNPEKFKALNPELQELKNIKMEDNPVIVIAKYKK